MVPEGLGTSADVLNESEYSEKIMAPVSCKFLHSSVLSTEAKIAAVTAKHNKFTNQHKKALSATKVTISSLTYISNTAIRKRRTIEHHNSGVFLSSADAKAFTASA